MQAYHGHAQALEVLLQGEREVDQGDEAGRTPLALAAMRGHTDCVHTLLSQGASPHTTDARYGRTPVHLAGEFRSHVVCMSLITFAVKIVSVSHSDILHISLNKNWLFVVNICRGFCSGL